MPPLIRGRQDEGGIVDETGIWIVLYVMLFVAGVLFGAWFFRVVFRVDEIRDLLKKIVDSRQ